MSSILALFNSKKGGQRRRRLEKIRGGQGEREQEKEKEKKEIRKSV